MSSLEYYNSKYPTTNLLANRSKKKIPKFVYDYLREGCNNEIGLTRNDSCWNNYAFEPRYLNDNTKPILKTEILGDTYSCPFGISAVGLQGAMWPTLCY